MNDQTKSEKVVCIGDSLFTRLRKFQGLQFNVEQYLHYILNPKNQFVVTRGECENDPDWKQLIPYTICVTPDRRVLRYKRQGSETRLHNLWSIGVGGHWRESENYEDVVRRELLEELHLGTQKYFYNKVALLYSDLDEVSRVHLGIVNTFEIEGMTEIKSEEIEKYEFVTTVKLLEDISIYEEWSKICVKRIGSILKLK